MTHRTFTAGDVDYITRLNALASSLDRRLAQNILINGSMQVWQRGTSIAGAAARVYGPDRWSHWRTGAVTGMTVSRQAGSDSSRYCARVQRDSGNTSTAVVWFAQALTTENTIPLRAKRLGVRFRARRGANFSGAANQVTVRLVVGLGTDEHPATPYTSSGNISTTAVTLTTSWAYYEVDLGTMLGNVTEAALAYFYTPAGTAGAADYFEVTEVTMTPTTDSNVDVGDYPWRSFEEELDACLPYYEKSFPYATAPAQNTGSTIGATAFCQLLGNVLQYAPQKVAFKRQKRSATPTVTLYNTNAANAQIRNASRGADWSGSTVPAAGLSEDGFVLQGTGSATSALGDLSYVHWAADAEL